MEKFLIKPKKEEKDLDFEDSDSETSSNYDNDSEYDSDDTASDLNTSIKDAVDPLTFFTSKELCYYRTIHKFFKKCGDKEIIRMLDIINGDSSISLRVLDWFVTRYSKRKIDFSDSNENTLDSFDVHISYKSELKSYKKRYFDPFRRRRKFYYPLYLNELHYTDKTYSGSNNSNNSKEVVLLYTTLGQLNFFMWAITNNIINYVEKNLEQISKAMNANNKDEKKKKQKIITKKKKTKGDDSNDKPNEKETKDLKESKVEKQEKGIDRLKKLSEEKKKNNNNNVFNNYYDEFDDTQLILNFD